MRREKSRILLLLSNSIRNLNKKNFEIYQQKCLYQKFENARFYI